MSAQAISLDTSTVDPIAALKRVAGVKHSTRMRRTLMVAAVLAAGGLVALAAPKVLNTFGDALVRAIHADPAWVVAGVVLELASFTGYIALFWHVASRRTKRIGLRASGEIALASTAATRLLPTAGAGGAALTFWSLRRAGQDNREATGTLLSFLVVLYSIFLGAILIAGTLLATGAVPGDVPAELSAIPAAAAGLGIALALLFARRHSRRGDVAAPGRLGAASHALGGGVRDAIRIVRRPDARLLGAPAWWGFDMLVLWATFNAFGAPPAATVLVLGYFLGQVANTVPIPGAASGGMVGAFLALGMPAEVVLPAVLAYRAIAIWTPVPAGAFALSGLRRRVRSWADEDGVEEFAEEAPVIPLPTRKPVPAPLPMPVPLPVGAHGAVPLAA
ncbi:MAG: hypothetical protein QOH76_1292 [Thermoleophilaceae bacterium]|jgi:uncharacterized membrane protein YbhN (UPF0104 family)|nr:hypothetical protein [Thermoleophilaceae bacterium]